MTPELVRKLRAAAAAFAAQAECAKARSVPTRTPQVPHEFREAKQNNPSPTTGAAQ